LSPANRHHAEQALARASEALKSSGVEPSGRLWVPGRIEVLGKHTDYAGGRSLTCAVERGFAVAFAPRSTPDIRIVDAHDRRHAQFALTDNLTPPVGEWINYPMTVARRLARNFPGLATGADIAFYSNLPRAAGLSTSSALITAVYLVLTSVNDLPGRPAFQQALPSDVSVAGYLGSIENGQAFGTLAGDSGVGTFGGSEDHTAILLSAAGVLGSYHYRPVTRLRRCSRCDRATGAPRASRLRGATADRAAREPRDRSRRGSSSPARSARTATPCPGSALPQSSPRRSSRPAAPRRALPLRPSCVRLAPAPRQ